MFRHIFIAIVALACVFSLGHVAFADTLTLKAGSKGGTLGGNVDEIKGKIISGARPGDKEGEVVPTADEVTVAIYINGEYVGEMSFRWDRIESIKFSRKEKSYKVNLDLRKKQIQQREREAAEYARFIEEQKKKEAEQTETQKKNEKKKEEKPGFMPDEEKQIDTWIEQLGLGGSKHVGRRNHAKMKLIEAGKKIVDKLASAMAKTDNKLQKRYAAEVLEAIGPDAESALDELLDVAGDDDKFARFAAIEALRKITAMEFGYSWDSSPQEQRAAVKRWRNWWTEEQAKRVEEEKKNEPAGKEESDTGEAGSGKSEKTKPETPPPGPEPPAQTGKPM